MSGLVLELKQDELIIINGVTIRFRTKSRIEINGKARFLFGKQILSQEDANTPARRIYFSIQEAYIGADEPLALQKIHNSIEHFRSTSTSYLALAYLDEIMSLVKSGEYYEALKLARSIIRHESAALKTSQPP